MAARLWKNNNQV